MSSVVSPSTSVDDEGDQMGADSERCAHRNSVSSMQTSVSDVNLQFAPPPQDQQSPQASPSQHTRTFKVRGSSGRAKDAETCSTGSGSTGPSALSNSFRSRVASSTTRHSGGLLAVERSEPLHDGTTSHYFLSHKKHHTKGGRAHAEIAKNLHDQLELLGFCGWFDIDDLKTITKEAIDSAVSCSSTMIVLLNDETHESEWCRFEWAAAVKRGLPIKVLVDLHRTDKQAALEMMLRDFPELCKFQWIDYTEAHRRNCVAALCEFLAEWALPAEGSSVGGDEGFPLGAPEEEEDWDQRRKGQLLHPWFKNLLVLSGNPISPPNDPARARASAALVVLLHVLRFVVILSLAAVEALEERTPFWAGHQASIAIIMMLLVITYAPHRVHSFIRTRLFSETVKKMERSSSAEVLDRMWRATKLFSVVVILLAVAFSAVIFSSFVPMLLVHPDLDDADVYVRTVSFICGICIVLAAFPLAISILCLIALMAVLQAVAAEHFKLAFDDLHPQIKSLGFERYCGVKLTRRMIVKAPALCAFKERINDAVANYRSLQQALEPLFLFANLLSVVALTLPLGFLTRLDLKGLSRPMWPHALQLMFCQSLGIVGLVVTVICPYVMCSAPLREVQRLALTLVTERPDFHVVIEHCVRPRGDLDFGHAGLNMLIASPLAVNVVLVAFAASAGSWWFVV